MRIVFTGGGSGGHFFPIIAVVQALKKIEQKDQKIELYYFSTDPYDRELLSRYDIVFRHVPSGKLRTYFSFGNILDVFVMGWGILVSFFKLFPIYPDIVFSKGGYGSFPTVVAARLLGIPIFIHESDTVPGRVNKWAGLFARRIAISHQEASDFFPKGKTAYTSQPIREELLVPPTADISNTYGLAPNVPLITVLGGSMGAQRINDLVVDSLEMLLPKYQIIHVTGKEHEKEVQDRVNVLFQTFRDHNPYKAVPFLSAEELRNVAGKTSLFISRSGSSIFEIAAWGVPSILIPIPESISRDQRTNAFSYARHGGAVVIEEENLTAKILLSEVDRILQSPEEQEKLKKHTQTFVQKDAATIIAQELLRIAGQHE